MDLSIPPKPVAPTNEIERRWRFQAKKRRMLTGNWAMDLEDELQKHLPTDRRAAWGISDLSSCALKSISSALSALYDEHPIVSCIGPNAANAALLLGRDGLVDKAGLWSLMQYIQMMTIGINDMFIRIDVNSTKDGLFYRPVFPDMISAFAPTNDPMQPNYIEEYRLRMIDKNAKWTLDLYDLRNPNKPTYEIYTIDAAGHRLENITKKILGSNMSGRNYPYRDSQNKPFLPFVAYHSAITGRLFSAFDNAEITAGSLSASMQYTFYTHMLIDCSHPQRYLVSLQPAGMDVYEGDSNARRAAISTDPASILCFVADPDTQTQPMVGQFQPGGDPLRLLEAITIYERRLAVYSGISPADIQKSSGDPRSGMAISLSQSAKREAQRRYAPIFRYSDIHNLEISAKLANRFLNMNLPESGYRIKYQSIPLTPEERKAQREDLAQKIQLGLIGPIEAIKELHPDFDDDEAIAYLRKIRKEKIEFS